MANPIRKQERSARHYRCFFLLIALLPWTIGLDLWFNASQSSTHAIRVLPQVETRLTTWQEPDIQADNQPDSETDDSQDVATGEAEPELDPNFKSPDTTSQATALSIDSLIQQGPFQRPFRLDLHGPITLNTQRFIRAGIQQARRYKADLVVVDIDSPGGGAAESMEIGDMLASITFAPTVAFISREATSGGALSAFGCQHIVLQDGATIGDIGVIQYNPIMDRFQYAPAKIRSILVAKARALNERHGRPADLGEAMVDEFAVVYQNEKNPNLFRLVSMGTPDPRDPDKRQAKDDGLAKETLPGGWRLIPESRPGRFLTLTSKRAEQLQLTSATVDGFSSLEQRLGIQGGWTRKSYGVTDRIVDFLNNFWITGLLLLVGIIAMFIEISAPGISVGGLIALLCFSLFFWSHFAGGTAGWLEVLLFMLGLVFIAAEVFVIPGFGVAGIMGIGLVVSSLVMACLDFLYPQTSQQWGQLGWSLLTVMTSGMGGVVGIFVALHYLGDIPVLRRFTLQPPDMTPDTEAGKKSGVDGPVANLVVTSGRGAGLKVGDQGTSESVLRPAGRARIEGRSVDVTADGKFIEPNRSIVIVDVRANRIIVSETGIDQEPTTS